MEETGFIFDKLIMLIAGVYLSFIWPKNVKKKLRNMKLMLKN